MNDLCFFVSDLHGKVERYKKLFDMIESLRPRAVFFGGDLLPAGIAKALRIGVGYNDFVSDFMVKQFSQLKDRMKNRYPAVFLILGNDDPRIEEKNIQFYERQGLWRYIHMKCADLAGYTVYGYSYVPPTPFMMKDWERYDVSRYVDPGCSHPTTGFRTVNIKEDIEFETIRKDLNNMTGDQDLSKAIFLFHSPPYYTFLDRAALDGVKIDHVPADVHVGSIAIKELIEERSPYITMHGHIHESSRITGYWKQKISKTWAFSAAYDGEELAVVQFSLAVPHEAERVII